jgi:hypothetical protein
MNKLIHSKWGRLTTAAFLVSLAGAQAGSFTSDFNSGLPTNCAVYGNAVVETNGGYTNSGCLQLTTAVTNQHGTFIITNDLDAGAPVVSFTASFKVRIGGSPARWEFGNGLSFNFADNMPFGTWGGINFEENPTLNGLTIGFETVKGNAGLPAPAILARASGAYIATNSVFVDNLRANTLVDCVIQFNPDSTLSVIYDGVYVYTNEPVSGFSPNGGSLFGLGAHTGDWVDNHFIDNLNIVTRTTWTPFINSFAPRGRQVQPNSSLDVMLTDFYSFINVDTNTIVLKLDGQAVSPKITQQIDQNLITNTTVHFAPASGFAAGSTHSVSIAFADNSTPAQSQSFSWQFTTAETMPTNFVTVFSDGFESYKAGYLDKNLDGDPNYAPNGSGNPWFGPWPENFSVVSRDTLTVDGTNLDITPHSGTNMITTAWPQYTCTIWADLADRTHGGQPIRGNCRLDWWFFDANDQANGFMDYISLYYYNTVDTPATADWSARYTDPSGGLFWDDLDWGNITGYQSLSLGGSGYSQTGGNYDAGKYQIRLEEMAASGTYGIDGWCNTINRTQGWHHNRILMGPPHANGTVMVYFYIDDMNTPVYSGLSTIAAQGITLLEIDTGRSTATLPRTRAFYDDISFALVRPPNLVSTRSGKNMTLNWPGEGFTLQSASSVNGPWSDVSGAVSGYTYDTTSSPMQYFRLRN